MRIFSRSIRSIILLVFFISTSAVLSQDAESDITAIGSGIVAPLFQQLADASAIESPLNISVTGTSTGFSNFCAGEADITLANRSITSSELDACSTNNVEYLDLLIGHDIIAFVTSLDTDFATCLDTVQLNTVFAPSARSVTTNWNQVIAEGPDAALSLYLTGDLTPSYAILDSLIEGDGIRSDVNLAGDADGVIAGVSENVGALGVISLPSALAAGDTIKILDLDTGDIPGCQSPTAENVENNLYTAADELYTYVNVASLNKDTLADLLRFMLSAPAAEAVAGAGFTAPTADAYESDLALLEAGISGEEIVRAPDDFTLPAGVVGEVNIGGAAEGFTFIQQTTTSFNSVNPDITVNLNVEGEVAGFRRFCNGEIDIALASRDLNGDEATNCEANNITTYATDLGSQAVVLVANSTSDYLACLTSEQLTAVWAATGDNLPLAWNEIDSTFPETAITLFAPSASNIDGDLLIHQSAGSALGMRVDPFENRDPLYRAAAVGNVDGGLTYMSWADYQQVLANNQANITLVGVDNGSGCVTPSVDTITDGTYPLSRSLQLIVNQAALARPEVQALIWYVFSNDSFINLENSGFIGIRFGDLTDIRANLQAAFIESQSVAAEAAIQAAETTPEATVEADSTEEAVTDATAEATEEATTEATAEVTAEATEDAGE